MAKTSTYHFIARPRLKPRAPCRRSHSQFMSAKAISSSVLTDGRPSRGRRRRVAWPWESAALHGNSVCRHAASKARRHSSPENINTHAGRAYQENQSSGSYGGRVRPSRRIIPCRELSSLYRRMQISETRLGRTRLLAAPAQPAGMASALVHRSPVHHFTASCTSFMKPSIAEGMCRNSPKSKDFRFTAAGAAGCRATGKFRQSMHESLRYIDHACAGIVPVTVMLLFTNPIARHANVRRRAATLEPIRRYHGKWYQRTLCPFADNGAAAGIGSEGLEE